MESWVKLYRKFTDWEWYSDINCRIVFLHILLTANWKPRKWQGRLIDTGEVVTSYPSLAESVGITEHQVRTAIGKMESCGTLTRQTTNRYTIIKLNNYMAGTANRHRRGCHKLSFTG